MNVSRREAIKTGFFSAIAGFLFTKIQPYIEELAEMEEPVAMALSNELFYVTRRSYLCGAVGQIYNTSPLLTKLLSNDKKYFIDIPIYVDRYCPEGSIFLIK